MTALPFLVFALLVTGLWLILFFLLPPLNAIVRNLASRMFALMVRSSLAKEWMSSRTSRIMPLLPTAIILVVGAMIATAAGDDFLDLAEELRQPGSALFRVDSTVYQWVASTRSPAATRFFLFFSTAGGPIALGVIVTLVLLLLLAQRRFRWAAYLAVTVGGGSLLDVELKSHFARARPLLSAALMRASGYSFPSGHAMGSVVVWGALCYLLVRTSADWRTRSAFLAFSLSIVLTVAMSRIYLGVHWTSDIGAGLTGGLAWLIATTCSYETLRHMRNLRATGRSPQIDAQASGADHR